jgi:hypothetical protein
MRSVVLVCLVIGALMPVQQSAADELKDDAVSRVAHSHHPDVAQAIARIYIKQTGLTRIRTALADHGRAAGLGKDWNASAPEWQDAESRLSTVIDDTLARRVEDPQWFYDALSRESSRIFNAEEADEVATHFASEGGRLQCELIDYKVVGEMLMTNYTFTNRIRQDVHGTEKEMAHLQELWWAQEPFKKRDFSQYPNAMHFAGGATGVKYVKMLVMQGVAALMTHINLVAGETTQSIAQAESEIDPFIARFQSRTIKQ